MMCGRCRWHTTKKGKPMRRHIVEVLIVGCFVGAGWLAASYFQPVTPQTVTVDNTTVWTQQQKGHLITPEPAPSPTDTTERSI